VKSKISRINAVPKLWDRRAQDSVVATASGQRHTTVSTAYLKMQTFKETLPEKETEHELVNGN